MSFLPPVIATLIADTKEYMAKMTEAQAKMGEFGKTSMTTAEKMTAFGKQATTAVAGVGVAMIAYGVDKALKYNEALDKIQNQAGASASEIEYLKGVILNVSNQTAISSDLIANAFLQVEKAGIRGAAAYKLVDNAAKAAAITGGDVAAIATTIVAAQALQITKGQSVAQVTDTLVKANQNHIGSLDNLVGLLKGRVGGALAAYGINLGEAASVADIAAKAGYNNARSMTTLATGLGKVENPTKTQTKALAALGINADELARKARTPGTGLIDTLKALEVQSQKTGVPLEKLVTATFGAGAVGLVSALAKQLPALTALNTSLQSSSSQGLATAFGITSSQLNFKIAQIKTQLTNALTGIGITFLPTVAALANVVTTVTAYLQKHPVAMTFLTDSVSAAIGLALSTKIAGFGLMVARSFGVAAATADLANPIGMAIAVAMYSTWSVLNSKELPKTSLGYWVNKLLGLTPTGGSDTKTVNGKTMVGELVNLLTMKPGQTYTNAPEKYITKAQDTALMNFVNSKAFSKLTATQQNTEYQNALKNFASGDLKGNYSVTINVK
jgi:TP901 family phage tail tape measure protein